MKKNVEKIKTFSRANSKAQYRNPKKASSRAQYSTNRENKKAASRANSKARYVNDPASKKAASKAQYINNPASKKAASRANSKAQYINNPAGKKAASRASSKAQYLSNPASKKAASKAQYLINSVAASRRYYHLNKDSTCARKRDRYALVEPKSDVKDTFVKDIEECMLNNKKAKAQLIKAFKKQNKPDSKRVTGKVVCKISS